MREQKDILSFWLACPLEENRIKVKNAFIQVPEKAGNKTNRLRFDSVAGSGSNMLCVLGCRTLVFFCKWELITWTKAQSWNMEMWMNKRNKKHSTCCKVLHKIHKENINILYIGVLYARMISGIVFLTKWQVTFFGLFNYICSETKPNRKQCSWKGRFIAFTQNSSFDLFLRPEFDLDHIINNKALIRHRKKVVERINKTNKKPAQILGICKLNLSENVHIEADRLLYLIT